MSIREDLKAYLDGELPPARMEEVRRAIEADPALRNEADYMSALSIEIRELSAEPEIVGMEKVLGAVTGRSQRSGRHQWNRAWVGAAACLVVLFAAAAIVKSSLGGTQEDVAMGDTKAAVSSKFSDAAKASTEKSDNAPMPPSAGTPMPQRRFEKDSVDGNAANAPMPKDVASKSDTPTADSKSVGVAMAPMAGEAGGGLRTRTKSPQPDKLELPAKGGPTPAGGAHNPLAGSKAFRPGRAFLAPKPEAAGLDLNGRKSVVSANIVVNAEDPMNARRQAERIAKDLGGLAEPQSRAKVQGGDAGDRVNICVPQRRLKEALQKIGMFGDVVEQTTANRDARAEHRHLSTHLSTLKEQMGTWGKRLRQGWGAYGKDAMQPDMEALQGQITYYSVVKKSLEGSAPMANVTAVFKQKAVQPGAKTAGPIPPKKRMPPADATTKLQKGPRSTLNLLWPTAAAAVLALGWLVWWLLRRTSA